MSRFARFNFAAFVILIFSVLAAPSLADESKWLHADSLVGEPKYGPDFEHYDYVNPDAPKGGHLKRAAFGGFDTFNPFVVKGRAPIAFNYWGGVVYDRMMEQSRDQAGASYGLVAEAYRKADDYSWAVYRINPNARWHDGEPIKPEDVIWSMESLRKTYPLWKEYFKNVETIEKTGEHEVTFKFDQKGNRELPHIIGDLVVLPKHWWEGTDASGNKRDITKPTTEPPLGSGPYKIKEFDLGKSITYERVKDYWAKDLPVRKGRYNIDTITYTYFLNENAIWEAFKKGGITDYRVEPDTKVRRWVKEYDFPAVKSGEVEQMTFPLARGQLYEGFFFNTRLEKFSDPRVRHAITLMLDFESLNKNQFFGKLRRTDSFFEGDELDSSGIPQGRELEILEEFRDQLPAELFEKPFALPDYSRPGEKRKVQRQALKLLKDAGFTFGSDRKLIDPNGNPFTVEIITRLQQDEVYINPFVNNLRQIGIDASLRVLDTAQFKLRTTEFDFEITNTPGTHIQSLSPGNEQREFWSSRAAVTPGSRNYSGIKHPAIDALIERIILAPNREELVHLTHALDRILKWNYYAVPLWHNPEIWFAKWKHVELPLPQPAYVGIDPFSFWIDPEKTGALNN
ncbi:MAG: extracellular solute-binding protein [Pseudomonadota bacterium]